MLEQLKNSLKIILNLHEYYDLVDVTELTLRGSELKENEVVELETRLRRDPHDIRSRNLLLGYYYYHMYDETDEDDEDDEEHENEKEKRRANHALWVIKHIPKHDLASDCSVQIDSDEIGYEQGKELWLHHVKKNKKDIVILGNAADFFMLPDKDAAEKILRKARSLQPFSPEWPNRLSQLYELNSNENSDEYAIKALKEKGRAYGLARKFGLSNACKELSDLPMLAYKAGDFKSASVYANKLLKKCKNAKCDIERNAAIHNSNTVLGLLAFDHGEFEKAKKRLLESTVLSTRFAPPPLTILAKKLFETGFVDVVLEYLELAKGRVIEEYRESWINQIKNGELPDDWKYK